ncbi:unnamed protein product [Nippostrongylus brasiliensis]|uniref:UmuC domain-containing protein n=1 Tax=Nippostrongylus brasiliensis TaxID=27835 RepID=A0A0N4Y4F0_NIPBR|nr:unnamed protein product [Nippostrongylus brasiliensis]
MMQSRKINYSVIILPDTRRDRSLHAMFDIVKELFLGTCDSRGVRGVGVSVNTNLAMNINSFKQLTIRVGHGTLTSSMRAMEKVIYDFYSDLFDSYVFI